MTRQLPAWQLQALAAHRRDAELRKAEELKKVAHYFEKNTRASKLHEQWTTQDYYERATKDAELLNEKKTKSVKLQERRKKLELLLFQENMQLQEELKHVTSKPKLFKNGSLINDIPTSALEDINQGIREKEEELRRHEAELRLHHAWRARQPELRAAESYVRANRCKSAWMEQIIEKEMQKQKEEEETRQIIKERDESIRRQIQIEEERLREKEQKMKELRSCLEDQIAELSDKEKAVGMLRKQEEKQRIVLDQLKFLAKDRVKQHEKLASEQKTMLINMGLYKYKLKQKVKAVLMEIDLDLQMLENIKLTMLKDFIEEIEKDPIYKRLLDDAYTQLQEHREREALRQASIEALYDGEARLMAEKQDKERRLANLVVEITLPNIYISIEAQSFTDMPMYAIAVLVDCILDAVLG
ncbi:hypothetical protein EVAR_103553_1 [Eumeta japonica]|uniref:Trichoplein keratin filament-binding protein n=1 Tax=Eumeta variegata TaxID=151549 RepID=A0A4C1YJB9_EUMVA|nr:hypothetical protein EVAR_103553_1 [Eumeta japonica]